MDLNGASYRIVFIEQHKKLSEIFFATLIYTFKKENILILVEFLFYYSLKLYTNKKIYKYITK